MPSLSRIRLSKQINPPQKGFALVIALSLMGFIVLMFLALSAMVQHELATTAQQRNIAIAKQNALLGVMTALGELQKVAGPDARVTARADIFVSDTGLGAAEVQNPYWMGVWPSNASNWNTLSASEKLDLGYWMVSGNEGLTPGDSNYLTPEDSLVGDSEAVTIFPKASEFGQPEILAKRVEASEYGPNEVGHYAYWITGNNEKALISISDPNADSTNVSELNRSFQVNQRTGAEAIQAISNYPVDDASLENLESLALGIESWQSDAGTEPTELSKHLYHDLTTYSKGLLVDVKDGALKRDLTQAFEINSSFAYNFPDQTYGSSNAEAEAANPLTPEPYYFFEDSSIVSGSPNWAILRDYYQHYWPTTNSSHQDDEEVQFIRAMETSEYGNQVHKFLPFRYSTDIKATDPFVDDGLPYQVVYDETTFKGDNYQIGSQITPVISQVYISHAFSIDRRIVDSPVAEILVKPVISLFNPYNTKLKSNDFFFSWTLNPLITLTFQMSDGSSPSVSFYQSELQTTDNFGRFRARFTENQWIPPGSVLHTAYDSIQYENLSQNKYPDLEWKWNSIGGVSLPLDLNTDGRGPDSASSDGAVSLEDASSYTDKTDHPAWGLTNNERTTIRNAILDNAAINIRIDYYSFGSLLLYRNSPEASQTILRVTDIWKPGDDDQRPSHFEQSYDSMDDAALQDSFQTIVVTQRSSEALDFAESTSDPVRTLIDYNVRAIHSNSRWDGSSGNPRYLGLFDVEVLGGNELEPDQFSSWNNAKLGYWGNRIDVDGQTEVMLFDRPRVPLLSLGQLQHANMSRYHFDPTYMVGNSYAPVRIDLDKTKVENFGGESDLNLYDSSYLVNERLWDGFFFSTVEIPRTSAGRDAIQAELDSGARALNDLTLNPRMEFLSSKDGDGNRYQSIVTEASTFEEANDAIYRPAREMWVNGAFNINSTSVDAWVAVLAGSSNLSIPIYEYRTETQSILEESNAVFSRLSRPYSDTFNNNSAGDESNYWKGIRSLSNDQVRMLAENIVEQVKARGPFLNMASFVNRRLGNDEYAKAGALQAAIDSTEGDATPINDFSSWVAYQPVTSFNEITNFKANNLSSTDSTLMGFPGYLLQADILQHLAPILTVRSDTFTIRAYGDIVNNLTNKTKGRVWCEVTVQRVPTPVVDAGETPDGLSMNEWVQVQNAFGRQFKIISFRWINENEV